MGHLAWNPALLTWALRLAAWALTVTSVLSLYRIIRDILITARQMHQIPCSQCRYFTQDYFLKCPVHPMQALSEQAIGCRDYEAHHP